MNRADFQRLADVRLAEARALLAAGLPDGAYYLAGYAVEDALKACVAKMTNQYDFPKKDTVLKSYTHKLADLMMVAGLDAQFTAAWRASKPLESNWITVRKWSEQSRYATTPVAEAAALIDAIADPAHGVLPWLKGRW